MGRTCTRCLLPAAVAGAELAAQPVCRFCLAHEHVDQAAQEALRRHRQEQLETALEHCRGEAEYDCIVCLSGGKDSCYLLYKIREEYGLRPLAFTVDVNISDVAWQNIGRTVARLDVPHVTFRPPREVYRKLFRMLLSHQDPRGAVRTVCYICAPLTEGYALKLAVQHGIPLVLAGYSPGQPEPDRMEFELSREMICRQRWIPPMVRDGNLFDPSDRELFWDPFRYPPGTEFPRYLAPFHAWPYHQADVMRKVVELGLIANRRHANPVHSNCPVNWLLMYSDLKNLGYNPYMPEFSKLIREGRASRWYWRIMTPLVNCMIRRRILLGRNVTRSLQWLGMTPDELRIASPGKLPDSQSPAAACLPKPDPVESMV